MTKIPVILDTDIGTDIDDTWALAMLLNCPELDLRLITTATGDTVYRAHLVAKFLEVAERSDVPIGIGLGNPQGSLCFQKPWLEGYEIGSYPGHIDQDGIAAMIDQILSSPQPVTIVSIGPVTNIAAALAREPAIAGRCRFIGMHGSIHLGYGGNPGPVAEANVVNDVASLRNVFAAPWLSKLITPLDTCGLVVLRDQHYQQVARSQNPVLQALMDNYRIWAKLVNWMKVDFVETQSSTLFDTVAVYMAYALDLLEMEPVRLRITDDGLTQIDPEGPELSAAMRWKSLDGFHQHLVDRLLEA